MEDKKFKCVNCGAPSPELYRTYSPTVLKLTKCMNCNGIVDKYIEYDPVIVMIDLILISKEAQRHVIFNTEFKAYWKFFIILIMLETYGLWRNDSLFSIAVNTVCEVNNGTYTNSSYLSLPFSFETPSMWKDTCSGWIPHVRSDDNDRFSWEKDFYLQFLATFAGIVMFFFTFVTLMKLMQPFSHQNKVSWTRLLKSFTLSYASALLSLSPLVWGAGEGRGEGGGSRAPQYALVAAYAAVVQLSVFSVLYEMPLVVILSVLAASNCARYLTSFYVTPIIRNYVT